MMVTALAALWFSGIAGHADAAIKNTGTKTTPIESGTEFRVTGTSGNTFSGEVWVDRFVVEKGAKLLVQSTAVATPPPMAMLMVHARTLEIKGEIEMSPGGWGQLDVERKVVLSGNIRCGDTGRFRVNGCPRSIWKIDPTFRYAGTQPLDLYGPTTETSVEPLKSMNKNVMTCEAIMPNRTPVPPG